MVDLKLFQRNFSTTLKNPPFLSTPETIAELALHLERLSFCNRPNLLELVKHITFSLIGLKFSYEEVLEKKSVEKISPDLPICV